MPIPYTRDSDEEPTIPVADLFPEQEVYHGNRAERRRARRKAEPVQTEDFKHAFEWLGYLIAALLASGAALLIFSGIVWLLVKIWAAIG